MFKIVPKFSGNGFYDVVWGWGGDKATLIGQKYVTQETAAQNIMNQ
jgi:hypothetical protein